MAYNNALRYRVVSGLRAVSYCLLLAGVLFASVGAVAQNSGSITGIIVDSAGALIAGATVQAFDQGKTVVVRQTSSNTDGIFRLEPLQPGVYSVHIAAQGMKELDRRDINLDANQVLGLGTVTMQVGATSEHIEVTTTTPVVETDTSDHSAVIDSKQVTETLLNGRDFQSLLKTLPGVTSNNGSDFQLQFNNTDQMHINGLRGSANNVFLDGAINTDVGANDGQYTQLSMDAVGEFKVETSNFAAEYGRNPGVLIAINTKAGTSQFHGTLYEFNREDGFGGIPWGSTKTNFLRFNQFGANLGGPIPMPHAKNKMFFFFNYEGTRGLRPGNTQFAGNPLPGVGNGYNLPDPAWIGIGTPSGAYDFTSAYQYDSKTGLPVLSPNGFNAGQIYVPGSITQRDASGAPLNGTPICMNAGVACNIIQPNDPNFSTQAQAWVNYWKPHYLAGYIPDNRFSNNRSAALGGPLDNRVFVPFNETYKLFKHQEVIRYDWNINPKTNFFFRWVDDSQQEQYHNLFDFADYPILPEFRKKPGSSWSWNLVNVISPTLTNEFIFSYNHLTQVVDIQPGTPANEFDRTALGFTFQELYPSSNLDNRAPVMVRDNSTQNTFAGGSFHPGWHSEARQFTWTDNVTKVAGSHTLKFGVFFDYNQAGQQPVWQDTTFLTFDTGSANPNDSNNPVANTLFGWFTQAQQTNNVFFGAFRFHQVEAFGQDSWRVNRRLTLEYGLRWGYLGPTYTVQPFFANYWDITKYDPAQAVTLNTTPGNFFGDICSSTLKAITGNCVGVTNFGNPYNGIVQENHGIPPGFADHRYNNFGPRIGFSYDPFGDGKTAIRGGFGIFYERIRQNVNSFDLLGNPPLSYTATVFNSRLDSLGPQDVNGVLSPVSINAFDKKGQIPTITGYSLGVQRELPAHIGLEVAYVGNVGRHLQYQYNANATPIGSHVASATSIAFNGPFTGFQNINYTKYAANSNYNSLQVKATRRFYRDLVLTADFVWSKAMDLEDSDNGNITATNGGGNTLTDPYNPRRDWAVAGFDRARTFNINYIYTIPYHGTGALKYVLGGWQWGGLWKWWSGPPLDVTIGCSTGGCGAGDPGNFVNVVRPDLIPGVNPYLGRNNLTWLNPQAFALPADGSVGNVRRNSLRGPGINNWDMSLFKNINFTERIYLQLRLETYNTFNHPQPNSAGVVFVAPGADQSAFSANPSQGLTNGFRDPREVQLGAKFYF